MNVIIVFVQNLSSRLKPTSPLYAKHIVEYEQQQRSLLEACHQQNARIVIYYSDHLESKDAWSPFDRSLQIGIHESDRMYNALAREFIRGGDKIILLKASNSSVLATDLREAFDALNTSELVIGPGEEGDFYLLGMKELQYTVFEPSAWSGPKPLLTIMERLTFLRQNFQLLQKDTMRKTAEFRKNKPTQKNHLS